MTNCCPVDKRHKRPADCFACGQTTNVLIELMETGKIVVSVVITDPEEIYQWDEWLRRYS